MVSSNLHKVSAIAFMLVAGSWAAPAAGGVFDERAITTPTLPSVPLPSLLSYGGNLTLQFTQLTTAVTALSGTVQSLGKGSLGSVTAVATGLQAIASGLSTAAASTASGLSTLTVAESTAVVASIGTFTTAVKTLATSLTSPVTVLVLGLYPSISSALAPSLNQIASLTTITAANLVGQVGTAAPALAADLQGVAAGVSAAVTGLNYHICINL